MRTTDHRNRSVPSEDGGGFYLAIVETHTPRPWTEGFLFRRGLNRHVPPKRKGFHLGGLVGETSQKFRPATPDGAYGQDHRGEGSFNT